MLGRDDGLGELWIDSLIFDLQNWLVMILTVGPVSSSKPLVGQR